MTKNANNFINKLMKFRKKWKKKKITCHFTKFCVLWWYLEGSIQKIIIAFWLKFHCWQKWVNFSNEKIVSWKGQVLCERVNHILIIMVACPRIFKDCKSHGPTRWSGAPNLLLAVSLTDCAARHSSFDSSERFCSQEDLCWPLVVFAFHRLSFISFLW